MSKDTPEVGDVFQSNEDKDVRLHITGKNNVGLEAIRGILMKTIIPISARVKPTSKTYLRRRMKNDNIPSMGKR